MKIAKLLMVVGCALSLPVLGDPIYVANLSGAAESPSNASPGTGFAEVIFNLSAHTMRVLVTFSGLTGNTTASHIHCCTAAAFTGTASVATITPNFTGFPLGVTSGTYDHLFDLTVASNFNSPFVAANGGTAAGAEAALLAGLAAGKAYLNIHSTTFGGGEIRGFLAPIPEPGSMLLLGSVVAGIFLARRKRLIG